MPQSLFSIDNRIDDAVARRFGLDFPTGLSCSPELAINADLETMPELRFHMGWRRWIAGLSQVAVAAQFSRFQLRVPDPPSNIIVVVESITVSANSAGEWGLSYGYGPGSADLTTVSGLMTPGDGRQGLLGSQTFAASKFSRDTNAASGVLANNGIWIVPNQTPFSLPICPLVMAPGNGLLMSFLTVNVGADVTVVFRERRAQDKELVP